MRKHIGYHAIFKENKLSSTFNEKFIVYSIQFNGSSSIYIGSTTRKARRRWQDHISQLRTSSHANTHLQSAFNKYSEANMLFEIIEISDSESLLSREQYWIDFHAAYKKGFNRCPTAGNSAGIKRTEEQKLKQGELDNWKKANSVWRGSKHTEEAKAIIKSKRAAQVMKPYSAERSETQSNY